MKTLKDIFKELLSLQKIVIVVMAVNTFLFTFCVVHGSSMSPTLHEGDLVLLQIIGYTPEYGDIIVTDTNNNLNENLVKRVIGLSGDTIDFDESGNVTVNGEPIAYNFDNDTYGNLEYPFTVPEGCAFIMGDNRNNSIDSRYSILGPVKYSDIQGKVIYKI